MTANLMAKNYSPSLLNSMQFFAQQRYNTRNPLLPSNCPSSGGIFPLAASRHLSWSIMWTISSVKETLLNMRAYAHRAQSKAGTELSNLDIMDINKSQTVGLSLSRQTKSRESTIWRSLPTTKQRRDLLAMARPSEVSESKSSVHGLEGTGGLLDLTTRTQFPTPH